MNIFIFVYVPNFAVGGGCVGLLYETGAGGEGRGQGDVDLFEKHDNVAGVCCCELLCHKLYISICTSIYSSHRSVLAASVRRAV